MAAPVPRDLPTAVAQGDIRTVEKMLMDGNVDISQKSKDGMTPLAIAAFWGYSDIVHMLLKHGADVNSRNNGTNWTPLHCAAFQGHGPVLMKLTNFSTPDYTLKDHRGRTAADFASALDSIWPFFQAAGCKRTPKSELIKLDVVQKIVNEDTPVDQSEKAYFSRPGSSYRVRNPLSNRFKDPTMEVAAITGDVLASTPEEPQQYYNGSSGQVKMWNNFN